MVHGSTNRTFNSLCENTTEDGVHASFFLVFPASRYRRKFVQRNVRNMPPQLESGEEWFISLKKNY